MNPELRRNFWLEITPIRTLLMPGILGLVFFLSYLADSQRGFNFSGTLNTARSIFILIAFIWGCKSAAHSLQEELSEHTWDFQRMSPISAWTMTWGKFLGSTIYSWYGAIICLVVFYFAAAETYSVAHAQREVIFLATCALFAQSIALSLSFDAVSKSRSPGRAVTFGAFLIAIPFGLIAYALSNVPEKATSGMITWYGMEFDYHWFLEISLLLALAWCLLGAYRSMQVELQYQTAPWAWLGFLLYQMVYCAGFIPKGIREFEVSGPAPRFLMAYAIGYVWIYLMAISEPKQPVRFRKLARCLKEKDYKKVVTLIPRWFVTLCVTAIAGLLLVIASPESTFGVMKISFTGFIAASLLFAMRDLLIFLSLNFAGISSKRADSFALIYLIVIYFLIPMIIALLKLPELKVIFHPFNSPSTIWISIMPPLIETIIAAFVFWRFWKKNLHNVEVSN